MRLVLLDPRLLQFEPNLGPFEISGNSRSVVEIEELARTLGKVGRTANIDKDRVIAFYLEDLLNHGFPDVREAAAIALRPFAELVSNPDATIRKLLSSLTENSNVKISSLIVAETLQSFKAQDLAPIIISLFRSAGLSNDVLGEQVQVHTAVTIGLLSDPAVGSAALALEPKLLDYVLEGIIATKDVPVVRKALVQALPGIAQANIEKTLQTLSLNVSVSNSNIGKESIQALGALGPAALPVADKIVNEGFSQDPELASQVLF